MIFTVEGGRFHYPGGPDVLKDISFTAESGKILGILGPNGAGKTTLLRCMLGLLPWTEGRSLLDGQDAGSMQGRSFWRKVAYVPQSGGERSARTVLEQTLLGRASRLGVFSQPGRDDRAAAEEALERLGLAALAGQTMDRLSGGQRRMAAIARALAGEPELLVLDEPEANLDLKNQLLVLETIRQLAEAGMGVVLNTHHPGHALRYAHQAVLLEPGGRYFAGEAGQVITGERLTQAFGVKCLVGRLDTAEGSAQDVVALPPEGK